MDKCFKKRTSRNIPRNNNHKIQQKSLLKILKVIKPLLHKGRIEKDIANEYITRLQKADLEAIQKLRSSRIGETLLNLQNQDGELSVNKFWKLKNCVSGKTDERSSIMTDQNIEVFDDNAIINEYVKEFKTRLSHRVISPNLKEYEDTTHKLLSYCLEKTSNSNTKQDFTTNEVTNAINKLSCGKAPGPDMFPSDVFRHAGPVLIHAITEIMNVIKNKGEIPESWIEVVIVPLFKNKGSRKKLKNHRGVFLTSVLSKLMEKLIKYRIQNKLDNISPYQFGAKSNRSTCDNIFIINSLIDHTRYLNTSLYLTLYDYSTCFDSLWLEDSMISLWNLGVQDEFFPLIYKMNEKCRISIRTPYGTSNPFESHRIVKQGAVLSTSICGASTGELRESLKNGGANILTESVKAVLFVDDTTTINSTINTTIQSHEDGFILQ